MPKVTKKQPVRRQVTPCQMKQRNGQQLSRCFDCVRNSDECRFQERRLYNNGMGCVGFEFKGPSEPPAYRQRMNQRDSLKSIRAKMSALVTILEPILRDEYLHITSSRETVYHPLQPRERALCDVCFSDLFSRARFCHSCGFEVCGECLSEGRRLPHCSTNEHPTHEQEFLVPVSRFLSEEIETLLEQMRNFSASFTSSSSSIASLPMSSCARSYDVRRLQSWSSSDDFSWADSEPVICEGVLSRQQMYLTPAYFMRAFGNDEVDLTDCESGESKEGTLEDILKLFDSPQGTPNPVWKVKDWPSQATFRGGKFADIYEEFEDCLPFPHLTRLNGRSNLAAYFPDNAGLPPDLGPKVYFALGTKQDDDHHGSTRLHCDLTDAINICVFAARQSDSSPGGARWDIFSPHDTTRLRKVLRVHSDHEDPILAQSMYLSPSTMRELEVRHDIKACTFIQHEGDAVLIPAGCAHQVSNVTNTIKIACDFVSVEHLSTTIGLVSTFRHHRISKQSGDDVLQLYTTLLHAWCSLVRFHELYSKYADMDSEDCDGDRSTLIPSAAGANSVDGAMDGQADHAAPHVMPINPGLSCPAIHGSQSRRRRRAGPRRNGSFSCPVSSCMKQKFARVGLLDHINHKHTEYKLEGDTLRRLRNVSNCSSEEFLTVIQNHVETRRKLLEQAMRQLA